MDFIEQLISQKIIFENTITVITLIDSITSILGIGIIQIFVWLYKTIRSHLQKELKCRIENQSIITSNFSQYKGLAINYKGKPIKRFSITNITFWNNSKPLIVNDNVNGQYPFKAIVNGGDILDCIIVKGDKSECEIKVTRINNNTAKINFSVLHPLEGGIIKIYHTGAKDSVSIPNEIDGGKIKAIIYKEKNSNRNKYVSFLVALATNTFFILCYFRIISSKILRFIPIPISIIVYLILCNIQKKKFVPKNCRKTD